MLKKLLLASVAAATLAGAAQAADLGGPIVVAPTASSFSWTGFYAGLNLGYSFSDANIRYTGNPAFLAGVVNGGLVGAPLAPAGYDLTPDGFLGGFQLGFNVQTGGVVFGVEADLALADAKSVARATTIAGGAQLTTMAHTELLWLGTLRGRLGFAVDRTLFYVTGGLAMGGIDVGGMITGAGALAGTAWDGRVEETRFGWTLGAGLEMALTPNMSFGIDYLYYDLGRVDVTVAAINAATLATGIFATQRHDLDGHVVRARLNFRFGATETTVVPARF